tara:strand:- start:338 stop:577 length:240 start_codon:yes stop_codon:yes gene_type:complete
MGEIKEKPKKVKKTEEKPKKVKEEQHSFLAEDKNVSKKVDINKLKEDLDKLGDWIADVDDDLKSLEDLVDRIAKRMGME